jgi:phosphohistidine swiveling domain-containing protein
MGKRRMKKGILFSFIMIFLTISLLSLILLQRSLVKSKREQLRIEMRIRDMNRMYESVIRDVEKAIDIITKRAISVAISHVVTTGKGLEDAQTTLKELAWNGTLNGTQEILMENATIPEWIQKMETVGELKGYEINITIKNFQIKPYDSFHLEFEGEMFINITDKQEMVSLVRNKYLSILISIENFEDPLYPLNTLGRATNLIVKTPYENNYTILLVSGEGNNSWTYGESIVTNQSSIDNIQNKSEKILVIDDASMINPLQLNEFKGIVSENGISSTTKPYVINAENATRLIPNETYILVDGDTGKVWFIENLKQHISNSYYQKSSVGASFLDRLEGKLEVQDKYAAQADKTIGLESFVDKNYLLGLDLSIKEEQTNIDYLYFSNATITGDAIKGLDPSVRIDNEVSLGQTHQEIYNVTELTVV